MKKWWLLILLVVVVVLVLVKKQWREGDFKLGIITPNEIGLVSISPKREMVNLLTVNSETQIWIPNGMGWYPSNKVLNIGKMEKDDKELVGKIFFYNFGFLPDKIAVFDSVDEWRSWSLIKYLGVVEWARYVLLEEEWLYKTEYINRDLIFEKEKMEEILPRDFADNLLQSEEIKVSIYNASTENGLGSFMAERLNWMGFNVVEVENAAIKDTCEVIVNSESERIVVKYADLLAKLYGCSQITNNSLLNREILLYLGQNYASMIKYNSYIKQ